MISRQLLVALMTLLISGCALDLSSNKSKSSYNNHWSKARNLAYEGGLKKQTHDQQLPNGAYDKAGKLQDYKLNTLSHDAHGSAGGMTGVTVKPHGPFEHFYWGWSAPGAIHYDNHRIFAWMPIEMGKDPVEVQEKFETLLSRASLAVLSDMNYQHKPVQTPYQHEGLYFKQWYLEQTGGNCSFEQMNCVFSLYVPTPVAIKQAPFFAYYNMAGQPAWFFSAADNDTYPRLAITEGNGEKNISEHIFYQKLSTRLPGWTYMYMAPNKVGTGKDNKTIPYPYLLEKGKPLLFIRPVK